MQVLKALSAKGGTFTEVAMLAAAEVVQRDPTWYRLRYELYALGLRNPEFLPAVGEFLAKGRQMIAQVIQERTGIDETRAQAMAAVIHACTDGLALQQLAQPDRDFTTAYNSFSGCSLVSLCPGTKFFCIYLVGRTTR